MVNKYFSQEYISSIWPEFEVREEQVQLSSKIEDCIAQGKHLLAEAGTGVGKSLAYLLPAALHSIAAGETVIVATETKSLQSQLINKDIPIVARIIGKELKAKIALGASNYLCKRKMDKVFREGTFGPEMVDRLNEFYQWEKSTSSGIIAEYDGFASRDFWQKVTRDSDHCMGRFCPNFSHSYYFQEKEKWKEANILIVNHYLLASHIASDYTLLPSNNILIIDEAHNFPDILGRGFRIELTYDELVKNFSLLNHSDKKNQISFYASPAWMDHFNSLLSDFDKLIPGFYNALAGEIPFGFSGAKRITSSLKLDKGKLETVLTAIADHLDSITIKFDKESGKEEEIEFAIELEGYSSRLRLYAETINGLRVGNVDGGESAIVYWVEMPEYSKEPSGSPNNFYKICSQKLKVDETIHAMAEKFSSVIFTSATLTATKNNFSYFEEQIGHIESEKLIVNSPFDYKSQSVVMIAEKMKDPQVDNDGYIQDLIKGLPYLFEITNGNAFVLFTSYKTMNTVFEGLSSDAKYPIISQGEFGAEKAKNLFMNTPDSILFGVLSFWQGVDIKGDKLKSVIITRLPFQVPSDPILEAKIEEAKKLNGNPFMDIQLPYTSLLLKQGIGRLIRSRTDKGIISILDSRLVTKKYGAVLIESLPPAKIVYSTRELAAEFKKLR